MKCPNCGHELDEYDGLSICEVQGCPNIAMYVGWHRVKDFAGLDTGIIQRRQVCDLHKSLLIGTKVDTESNL